MVHQFIGEEKFNQNHNELEVYRGWRTMLRDDSYFNTIRILKEMKTGEFRINPVNMTADRFCEIGEVAIQDYLEIFFGGYCPKYQQA